jgi:hypothetical protein
MRYRYICAYELVGLVCPQGELQGSRLQLPGSKATAWLTGDIDVSLIDIDRGGAIGSMLLQGLFNPKDSRSPEERLADAIEGRRKLRQQRSSAGIYFVLQSEGEIDDFDPQPQTEFAGCIVSIWDTPKDKIKSQFSDSVTALLASFAIFGEPIRSIKKIADGTTFIRKDGLPIHCYQFSATGSAFEASTVSVQSLEAVRNRWRMLSRNKSLATSAALLTRSLLEDDDPLLAFLSAWSALEIFVNKNFKMYEKLAFDRLAKTTQPTLSPKLLGRIRTVMEGKYGTADKFSVIASWLAAQDADSDQSLFEELATLRNKLFHAGEVPPTSLPVPATRDLLRKYMQLHFEAASATARNG